MTEQATRETCVGADARDLAELCAKVAPASRYHHRLSGVRQRTLARPAGSLGRLDEVVHRVAAIRRQVAPGPLPAVVSVLASDHGVASQGTSLFPPATTSRVLRLIASGSAPVSLLAAGVGARVEWADFGLLTPVGDQQYKVAQGTADISRADAMTTGQALCAVANGARFASRRLGAEPIVAVGEIGVGNTTASAALSARLLGLPAARVVGAGSGVGEATIARKISLVDAALARVGDLPDDPIRLVAALGGFEIAGNVGVILAAAANRQVVVLDGFITAVAALVAVRMCPPVGDYLVAAHQSAERGHALLLQDLGQPPLLELGLRLGMGSGAALAVGLINAALTVDQSTPAAAGAGLVMQR